jgi:hypothetical protein
MKAVVSILLALLILLQSVGKVWILVSFHINAGYIAQNVCVQKKTVNNICKGKCYLKKKLAEAKEQEQKSNLPVTEKADIYYILPSFCLEVLQSLRFRSAVELNGFTPASKPLAYHTDIFHPPS